MTEDQIKRWADKHHIEIRYSGGLYRADFSGFYPTDETLEALARQIIEKYPGYRMTVPEHEQGIELGDFLLAFPAQPQPVTYLRVVDRYGDEQERLNFGAYPGGRSPAQIMEPVRALMLKYHWSNKP